MLHFSERLMLSHFASSPVISGFQRVCVCVCWTCLTGSETRTAFSSSDRWNRIYRCRRALTSLTHTRNTDVSLRSHSRHFWLSLSVSSVCRMRSPWRQTSLMRCGRHTHRLAWDSGAALRPQRQSTIRIMNLWIFLFYICFKFNFI